MGETVKGVGPPDEPVVWDVPNAAAWLRQAATAVDEAERTAHEEFRGEVQSVLSRWRATQDPDVLVTIECIDAELAELGHPDKRRNTPPGYVFRRAAALLDGKKG